MFEDVLRKLRDLQRRAEELDGEHSVRFVELFHDEFMLRNTDFPSVQAMFDASGFEVASEEDFAGIPDGEWDAYVRDSTRFDSWEEMKSAAVREWVSNRLGFEDL